MEIRRALCVFGIGGTVSVLVDIDHAFAALFHTLNPSFEDGRFLHPFFFAAACLLILYLCAHLGRLYIELVLRRRGCRK